MTRGFLRLREVSAANLPIARLSFGASDAARALAIRRDTLIVTWKLGGERATGCVLMNSPTAHHDGRKRRAERNRLPAGFALDVARRFPPRPEPPPPRLLFLDDDPARAEIFLTENPQAVWVQTVTDCIIRSRKTGTRFTSITTSAGRSWSNRITSIAGWRSFAGSARSRAIISAQRSFFVHTHNLVAALLMVMQMRAPASRPSSARSARTSPRFLPITSRESDRSRNSEPANRTGLRWLNLAAILADGPKASCHARKPPIDHIDTDRGIAAA